MRRRKFLRNLSIAGAGTFTLAGTSIKALGMRPDLMKLANNDHDKVLIILQLHGGNDGLNTVIPLADYDLYYSRRANIAIPSTNSGRGLIDLDSTLPTENKVGLHPDMFGVKELYDQGKAAIIQGVSYENNNGSHFRGRDIWAMGGGANDYFSSGWVGRYLQNTYEPLIYPDDFPNDSMKDPLAVEMGSDVSLVFHQEQGIPTSISLGSNPESFANLIDQLAGFDDEGIDPRGIPPAFLLNSAYGKEMQWLLSLEQKSEEYAERLLEVYQNSPETAVAYPETYPFNAPQGSLTNRLTPQLQLVARLLDGGGDGVRTKVFLVKMGGFDTHAEQVESFDPTMGVHAALMYHISEAVKAFQTDLRQRGIEDRALIVTTSEFGRRIASNGSYGTDHGTGGPVMMFGRNINPGVYGTNPDLNQNNVPMQFDYRQLYSVILRDWMEVPQETIINDIFFGNFFDGEKEDGGFFEELPLIEQNLTTGSKEFTKSRFKMYDVYPNPARESAVFRFLINRPGSIRLRLIDALGSTVKVLAQKHFGQGEHQLTADLRGLDPGVYFYQIEHNMLKETKKLVIY